MRGARHRSHVVEIVRAGLGAGPCALTHLAAGGGAVAAEPGARAEIVAAARCTSEWPRIVEPDVGAIDERPGGCAVALLALVGLHLAVAARLRARGRIEETVESTADLAVLVVPEIETTLDAIEVDSIALLVIEHEVIATTALEADAIGADAVAIAKDVARREVCLPDAALELLGEHAGAVDEVTCAARRTDPSVAAHDRVGLEATAEQARNEHDPRAHPRRTSTT